MRGKRHTILCMKCGWRSFPFIPGTAGALIKRQWEDHVLAIHQPDKELVEVFMDDERKEDQDG